MKKKESFNFFFKPNIIELEMINGTRHIFAPFEVMARPG